MSVKTVLVVDDEPSIAQIAGDYLRHGGFDVITASNGIDALALQPGRICTRAQLLDAVRGTDVDSFERAIDTHVKNIRRKLEPNSHSPRYILTVYGMGYKFAE